MKRKWYHEPDSVNTDHKRARLSPVLPDTKNPTQEIVKRIPHRRIRDPSHRAIPTATQSFLHRTSSQVRISSDAQVGTATIPIRMNGNPERFESKVHTPSSLDPSY